MKLLASIFSRISSKAQSQAKLRYDSRVSFFNCSATPHVIHVEPWGADYTLATNERFELVAYSSETEPSFELTDDYKDSTQVWCNEAETYEVLQEGKFLECGYNRDLASSDA